MEQLRDEPALSARERLKAFRASEKLTVRELAEKLGCSRSYLWAIFSGERKPGLELSFKIEGLTGICAREWLDHAA